MSRLLLAATLVVPTLAVAQLPTPAQHALAQELKTTVDALVPRTKQLATRLTKAEEALATAGVRFNHERDWEVFKQERVPTRQELAPIATELTALEADAKKLDEDCTAYDRRKGDLRLDYGLAMMESRCQDYFNSLHEKADCTPWRKLAIAFWPEKSGCNEAPRRVLSSLRGYARWRSDWEKEVAKEEAAAAQDALLLAPVSGNARQRGVPIPRKYVKSSVLGAEVDGPGLFNDAHPSHFVFLRKDVNGMGSLLEGERPFTFSRTLKKGEAVLATFDRLTGDRELSVLGIDGARATVSVEEVSVAPLSGSKITVLTPADLHVRSTEGAVVAGPAWLKPDATGFNLEEPNGWMDLLDPPEPRQQRFIDAKEKVLGCYRKQMDRLDPDGKLRKYYDVVTYGRGGIEKVESAAVNFDRKACAACGCKAFNDLKRKLITEAIAASQKQAFEAYRPVLEKLGKTDFAGAAKGAPAGVVQKNDQGF